jgi:hypothetical protein
MDRIVLPVLLAFTVMMAATVWKIFTKAGEPGWKSIVPVYGAVVFMRIVGRPWWMALLLAIPFFNLFPYIMLCIDLARAFGKGPGFTGGLTFLPPVFLMILAFGDARYLRLTASDVTAEPAPAWPTSRAA